MNNKSFINYASIKEIKDNTPHKYTLSNKNLIFMAHVKDETLYFYDILEPYTTIVLLSEPECYSIKKTFLNFCINNHIEVIDLREKETFDLSYKLPNRIIRTIKSLLTNNKFYNIYIHPLFSKESDIQNNLLTNLILDISKTHKLNIKSYKITKNTKKLTKKHNNHVLSYVKSNNNNNISHEKLYNHYYHHSSLIKTFHKI